MNTNEHKWNFDRQFYSVCPENWQTLPAKSHAELTKSLHKSGMPIGEPGLWTSDQVSRGSRVVGRESRRPVRQNSKPERREHGKD